MITAEARRRGGKAIAFPWQQGGSTDFGHQVEHTQALTRHQTVAVGIDGGVNTTPVIPINMQAAAKNGVKSPNMLGVGEPGDPCPTLGANDRHAVAHTLRAGGFDAGEDGTGRGTPLVPEVAWALQERDGKGPDSDTKEGHLLPTAGMAVRRLTPRECERLQGFPDDWTAVTFRGKPAADGPRYKALGNSMAVNVMRWIGERIAEVDGLPTL